MNPEGTAKKCYKIPKSLTVETQLAFLAVTSLKLISHWNKNGKQILFYVFPNHFPNIPRLPSFSVLTNNRFGNTTVAFFSLQFF